MLDRINVISIIVDHLKTLRNFRTKKISKTDITLFYIMPLVLSYLLINHGVNLKDQVSNLITSVSIFGGFLFNLLAIIYTQIDKLAQDISTNSLKRIFVNEIHVNIAYNILLSIIIILLLFIYISINFKIDMNTTKGLAYFYLERSFVFINYFLLINFILTLFMVLYRVYILLKKEVI